LSNGRHRPAPFARRTFDEAHRGETRGGFEGCVGHVADVDGDHRVECVVPIPCAA
jgi:hypothetical protein